MVVLPCFGVPAWLKTVPSNDLTTVLARFIHVVYHWEFH